MSRIVNSYMRKYYPTNPTNLKHLSPSINGTYSVGRIPAPRFSTTGLTTKSPPEMSEDEYKEAIISMAKEDATRGIFAENPIYMKLKRSFVSVAAPDRKGMISNALRAIHLMGSEPIRFAEFKDCFGNVIAHYSPQNGWRGIATPSEIVRESQFDAIYNDAWNAAAQSGKSKVKSINTVV